MIEPAVVTSSIPTLVSLRRADRSRQLADAVRDGWDDAAVLLRIDRVHRPTGGRS